MVGVTILLATVRRPCARISCGRQMSLIHNERTKLTANALDRASTGCLIASLIAPGVSVGFSPLASFSTGVWLFATLAYILARGGRSEGCGHDVYAGILPLHPAIAPGCVRPWSGIFLWSEQPRRSPSRRIAGGRPWAARDFLIPAATLALVARKPHLRCMDATEALV